MKTLPPTEDALVLRTDFSDQAAWDAICATIRSADDGDEFVAYVDFVDDPDYQGLTTEQILELIPEAYEHSFLVVVDGTAVASPENPVLVVDLDEERGREFRAIASELYQIENNLSIANMDFAEFAEAVDEDGVFRDF